jgi:hypothetical protein
MHLQHHLVPLLRELIKARERDEHFVADPLNIDEHKVRLLVEKFTSELAYHPETVAFIKTQVNITQKIGARHRNP